MNVSSFTCRRYLVLLLLLCGFVSQAGAALAQSGQCYIAIGKNGIMFAVPVVSSSGQAGILAVANTPAPSGYIGPTFTTSWTVNLVSTPPYSCYAIFTGQPAFSALSSTPSIDPLNGKWMPTQSTAGTPVPDGAYTVRVGGNGNAAVATAIAYCKGGTWSADDPWQSSGNGGSSTGSGSTSTSSYCNITVTCRRAATNAGLSGLACTVSKIGGTSYTLNTDTNGQAQFQYLDLGTWQVRVVGSASLNGSTKQLSATTQVSMAQGAGANVNFSFADDGSGSISNTNIPPAASSSSSNDTGFWQSLFQSLFVPPAEKWDALKAKLNDLVNWGPVGLVAQLTGLVNIQADPAGLGMTLPMIQWNPTGGPLQRGIWEQSTQSVPVNMQQSVQSAPVQFVRTLLGGAVYIGFALSLMSRWMPRPVF